MSHAPDMSPSLDDAIHAINELCTPFNSNRTVDLELVRKFLYSLDHVPQSVPVRSSQQLADLEGAYQAGFRVLNKIGTAMVVRTEDFLGYAARRSE